MKFTPHMVGAVAVVAIAGAVSGAAIGDSPVLERGLTETLPETPMMHASTNSMRDAKRPPDHYPLQTPNGTVEVAELSLHGRMRDRGGDLWWEGRDHDQNYMEADYVFYETAGDELVEYERRPVKPRIEGAVAVNTEQPAPTRRMTRAEAPMALSEPVEAGPTEPVVQRAEEASIGNSRTVDVRATLARRD